MKKANRILSLILILVFLLQFIPFGADGFSNYKDHTGTSFLLNNIHPENAIFSHESRKSPLKLTASKLQLLLAAGDGGKLYIEASFFNKESVFDLREKIRSTISEYFHGSKYKENCLYI